MGKERGKEKFAKEFNIENQGLNPRIALSLSVNFLILMILATFCFIFASGGSFSKIKSLFKVFNF